MRISFRACRFLFRELSVRLPEVARWWVVLVEHWKRKGKLRDCKAGASEQEEDGERESFVALVWLGLVVFEIL